MISHHTLPPNLLHSLSGPGDQAEIEFLQAGQVSRRLVQLRTILDLVQAGAPEAGRISGLSHSFATLAEAQRRNPKEIADLLGSPQVGAWAARCLRQLAGSASPTPVWIHLAHLGAIAATAALRGGIPFEVRVPVRSGVVSLPTLGRALLPHPEPWTMAVCTPGNPVQLDGFPPADWQPIRLLETETRSIPLDNADPYWTCFDLPISTTITDATIERWQRQLAGALAILAHRHHHRLAAITAAVRCLVPLGQDGQLNGVSASSRNAPGAVALSELASPDRFAATLVHEVQHFRTYALHDLVALHGEATASLYSPWRNDPRKLPGLLHGAVAFLGVADFWSRERPAAGRRAGLMYARTVRQLRTGCEILNDSPELTSAGTVLVAGLRAAVDQLPRAETEVLRLADDLAAHHRAVWRLRNVVPEPAEVTAISEKAVRGERIAAVAGSADRIRATAQPGGDHPLFRLAAAWVGDPEQVRVAAANPNTFANRYPGACAEDLHLLTGDYAEAHARRVAQISGGATDTDAWAALCVAHARLCTAPSPLATRPELVRAAWPVVVEAGGDALEALVSRYVAGTSTSDSMRR